MKFDILKVAQAIMAAMHVVEKIKGASGKQKAQVVIDSIPEMLAVVEAGLGRDVLEDARVVSARDNFIAAYKSLSNAIEDVKGAKVEKPPV